MKVKILLILSFIAFLGCKEEELPPFDHDLIQISMNGSTKVTSGSEVTYSVYDIIDMDYTWTIPTGATLVSGAGTSAIKVGFCSGQSGTVSVVLGNGKTDSKDVTVSDAKPTASVSYKNDLLKGGDAEVVTIKFDQDVVVDPTVSVASVDGLNGGTVGTVTKVVDKANTYEVTYTAAVDGDGVAAITVEGATSDACFGSTVMSAKTFDISTVDNTPATGTIKTSPSTVADGQEVTVSVKFTEALANSNDLVINMSGGGITPVVDGAMTTTDSVTWSYKYVAEGTGNGTVTISVTGYADDFVGNVTNTVGDGSFKTDNNAPTPTNLSVSDAGTSAWIEGQSSEKGTLYFVILEQGATAPTTLAEFTNSWSVSVGQVAGDYFAVSTGSYDVYFAAEDQVGNFSISQAQALVMD